MDSNLRLPFLRSSLRRRPWPAAIVPALTLTGAYIAVYGVALFERYSMVSPCVAPYEGFELAYRVLRLFVIEGEWVWGGDGVGPCGPGLKIASFAAPVASALTIAVAASKHLRRRVIRAWRRLRHGRPHTITIGNLSECALLCRSINSCEGAARESHALTILVDGDDKELDALWDQGATAIDCHGDLEERLERIGAGSADRVISFLDDDDAQFALALSLSEMRASGLPPLDLWVNTSDIGQARKIFSIGPLSGAQERIRLGVFDAPTLAAQQLFDRNPMELLADLQAQERVHLVIHSGEGGDNRGGDGLALAVAREAAIGCITTAGESLKITFFGPNAETLVHRLREEAPALEQIVEISALAAGSALDPQNIVEKPPLRASAHIVALDDEARALAYAVSLRRVLIDPKRYLKAGAPALSLHPAPVFVRVLDRARFGSLLSNEIGAEKAGPAKTEAGQSGIYGFGGLEDILSIEAIASNDIDRLGRAVHEIGYAMQVDPTKPFDQWLRDAGNTRPALGQEWDNLSHVFQESNRRAARHLAVKARAAGCAIISGKDGVYSDDEFVADLSLESIHDLARAEHERWWAERSFSGTVYGSKRSAALYTHNEFVPFDELGRSGDIDKRQIISLPKILRQADKGLRPRLTIGIIGHGGARLPKDDAAIVAALDSIFETIARDASPDGVLWSPVLISNCAPGADRLGVAAALEKNIPLMAALPLPAELYAEQIYNDTKLLLQDTPDWQQRADTERDALIAQIEQASLCVTVPSEGATARELWESDGLRHQQYLRAGRLLCARCDLVIAIIADTKRAGEPAEKTITEELIAELNAGAGGPEPFASKFFPSPTRRQLLVINANDPKSDGILEALGAIRAAREKGSGDPVL